MTKRVSGPFWGRNSEHYVDPTPARAAQKIRKDEERARREARELQVKLGLRLLREMKGLAERYGFRAEHIRIVSPDGYAQETGGINRD